MKTNLNLFAPINSLGYGIVAFNILKEMYKKCEVALFPINPNIEDIYTQDEKRLLKTALDNRGTFDGKAPCLKIWHEYDLANRIGSGPYYVLPFFEISSLDSLRINHLKCADTIFAPSAWAKQVILDSMPEADIRVVRMGVDSDIFWPTASIPQAKCIFFNCGKWEKRKGHDILLDAFQAAFPHDNSDVELWVMCDNPFPQAKDFVQQLVKKYSTDYRVQIIPRVKTHVEVANIMRSVTCGVFPSRAEGWNLELLEMMSLGKQVIATDYSAHTEFCTPENCFLIDIDNLEPAEDGLWFDGSSEWANLGANQIDQLINHMKKIYENWKNDKTSSINSCGIETAKKFTWANTASSLMENIYGSVGTGQPTSYV